MAAATRGTLQERGAPGGAGGRKQSAEALQHVHDVVRDAAMACDVGLLRLERRRGHLQDLFAGAAA